jgi:hypothetical protein
VTDFGCKDFVPPKTFGVEATATSIAEASVAAPESQQSKILYSRNLGLGGEIGASKLS